MTAQQVGSPQPTPGNRGPAAGGCQTVQTLQVWTVIQALKYAEDETLARFFSRCLWASPKLRGIDTAVSKAAAEQPESARLQPSLPAKTPILKTTPSVEGGDPLLLIFHGISACGPYHTSLSCIRVEQETYLFSERLTARPIGQYSK